MVVEFRKVVEWKWADGSQMDSSSLFIAIILVPFFAAIVIIIGICEGVEESFNKHWFRREVYWKKLSSKTEKTTQ